MHIPRKRVLRIPVMKYQLVKHIAKLTRDCHFLRSFLAKAMLSGLVWHPNEMK
jgi:hypothetical protein